MIKTLRASNFRSLGPDVTVRFEPLTVLVGINGSGKSNVVDALQFVSDAMRVGLDGAITDRYGIGAVRRWSGGRPNHLSLAVEVESETLTGTYGFTLTGDTIEKYRVKSEHVSVSCNNENFSYSIEDGRWLSGPRDLQPRVDPLSLALPLVAGDERFRPLADELRRIATYSIFPDVLRQPQKYDSQKPMKRHGTNWVSILHDQDEASWKPDLLAVLDRLTGDVIDVRVQPVAGFWTVQFKHLRDGTAKREKWFEGVQESDGTLRVAGMMTALLQQPRPSVIALEEPELTVHPGALRLLHEYIHEAATTGQVILTTHSPELLDMLSANEVRVVERREGITSVAPLDEAQREGVRSGLFSLGEMLRAEELQLNLWPE